MGRARGVELLLAECLRQIPASPEAVIRLMRAPLICLKGLCNTSNNVRVEENALLTAPSVIGFFKGKTAKSLAFLPCSWQNLLLLWEDYKNIDPELPACFSLEKQTDSDS